MKVKTKISGLSSAKGFLNSEGKKYGNQFQDELISRSRTLSRQIQADMSAAIDKGNVL